MLKKLKMKAVPLLTLALMFSSGALLANMRPVDVGAELLANAGPSVFILTPMNRSNTGGTGFVLDTPAGPMTITNQHVCQIAVADGYMMARMDDGRTRALKILKISDKTDLCMLEAPKDVPSLSVASWVERLERVHAVGHPLLDANTHNEGHMVKMEMVKIIDQDTPIEKCVGDRYDIIEFDIIFIGKVQLCAKTTRGIKTSVNIFPGNSGSPALNDSGRVVGVWFAGDSRTNYGFFVPLDALVDFIK